MRNALSSRLEPPLCDCAARSTESTKESVRSGLQLERSNKVSLTTTAMTARPNRPPAVNAKQTFTTAGVRNARREYRSNKTA